MNDSIFRRDFARADKSRLARWAAMAFEFLAIVGVFILAGVQW